MKALIALVALLIFSYHSCECIDVECDFLDAGGDFGYFCLVGNEEVVKADEDREIISIKEDHLDGKSDDDVIGFEILHKLSTCFPRGFTKFFKNIERLSINGADLQEVTKEDLKEFNSKLIKLNLRGNKIEKIPSDLFEFNPNLIFIDLAINNIQHVDNGAFSHLIVLETFKIYSNPCTSSTDEAYNRWQVERLAEKVEAICKK